MTNYNTLIYSILWCFITLILLFDVIHSDKPHIIYILIDDLGEANVEFNNPREQTPNLNNLLTESLYLNNFYVYKYCSPSRSALMTGRLPYHVNEINSNPCLPGFGVPLNMTMISERLVSDAGYVATQIGKWHLGFSSMAYVPFGRNFSSSLGYLHGIEDHYTQIMSQQVGNETCTAIDLWDTLQPAFGRNGTYNGYIYANQAVNIINNHSQNHPNRPLFMYLATQNNHEPYEVPQQYIDPFPDSWYPLQRTVAGMSLFLDELIYNVTTALKSSKMWNNTLLFITSDNGGPSGSSQGAAANNSPLRGGKMSNFQGGIRVIGMISGGYLPFYKRGKSINGNIHIADWYSTLCYIVDIDPTDKKAQTAGLPPIDSINMWPYIISNDSTYTSSMVSPRTSFVISSGSDGGIINGDYKLLFGIQSPAFWTTLDYPNGTKGEPESINCGSIQEGGCLFNIIQDPTEHNDIVNKSENEEIVKQMREMFIKEQKTTFNPDRGTPDKNCCLQIDENKGYWGPWLK